MRNIDNRPIDDLVFDCCRELFSSYRLEVRPLSRADFPAAEELTLCGVMGFGGQQLRGALVLATGRGPLALTNPGNLGSPRDWVCELANQLMGRVKNRLLGRGVQIHLATPAGLSGENLNPTPGKLRAPQVFGTENGYVCVWIDCELADGFQLPEAPASSAEAAIPEGETLLF